MPPKANPPRRQRPRNAKPQRRALRSLLPTFLRPTSKAWVHWNRASVEFLEGIRAAIDECIDDMERAARRREAGGLKRIQVG